ncbi:hypothetical protein QCD70_02135 [Agreia sp. PsM10]|uniref:hypothetical protein n=1 Tax=Agreia sp. PsM10 TaxID=3030533 RepID=UPI00263A89F2|nr:hypothetical protein [Agreia sp. PsM10]MDN4639035.1 hypothetical protein [Agreia sp. PsM10]
MAKNDARFPTVGASHHLAPGSTPDMPELVPSGPSSGARLKRATTVPFDKPVAPRRHRRAFRVALSVAFWLTLVAGGTSLIVAATGSGGSDDRPASDPDSRSKAYVTAVNEFRSSWSAEAIAGLGVTSIGITLETKYDEFSQTPRAYDALAEQCAALDGTRSRFDALADVPPPTTPSPAQRSTDESVNARVDEAAESIAPLAAAANELLSDGRTQLETLDTLCDSLTRLRPIADARASETAATATPLMVPPGQSEQVATTSGTVEFACSGDAPCQPLASPARESYGAANSAVNTRFDDDAAAFYSDHCPVTALADYCVLAADLWSQRSAVDTESAARFAKETPLNSSVPLPEYSAWLEKADAEFEAGQAALDGWLTAYSGGTAAPPGDSAFVTVVSTTADTAESRFAQLRDAASAAAAG